MEHVHGVDIYDIYDIVYEPWWLKTWFLVSCASLVLLLIVGSVYYWYRYKKKKILSYDQQLILKLEALKQYDPVDVQSFYLQLTALLKDYLHKRFHIAASGLTDDELLASIHIYSQIPSFVVHASKSILQGVTIIKFAQGTAAKETMDQSVNAMLKIIEGTKYKK